MKDRKPENHSLQLDRRQLLKWLGVTGSALTLGSLLPAGAFAADDEEIRICLLYTSDAADE